MLNNLVPEKTKLALKSKKYLLAGAAVVLMAAGCSAQTSTNTNVDTATPTPTATPTQSSMNPSPTPTTMAVESNDNTSLQTSLTGIDSQMNGLNSDSANIDSGMNEQQAP